MLYLLYSADLKVAPNTIIATYADDTATLTAHKVHVEASQRLHKSLFHIQIWLKKWRIRVNEAKSIQVTFTTRRKTYPSVILNGVSIPQAESARYLGLNLDRRLNWRRQISTKRKQLGIQLWVTADNSNIEIIQRFQNKYLRIIVNAPWYVTNNTLHHDLNVPYVRDEIRKFSQRYADRWEEHPNILAIDFMSEAEILRRLKRKQPQDLYI